MKNKIVFLSIISLASLFVFNFAHADTTIHLDIEGPNGSLYNNNITVSPCDSDNHGTLAITAYCAVLQLQSLGVSSVWDWYPFGAFLNSINNITGYTTKDANNNDVYHYWSWSLNSVEGTTGMNAYVLQPNDSILVNFYPDSTYSKTPGVGGLPIIIAPTFSIDKANSFLALHQKADGSFGDILYTDWVAISTGASSGNTSFFSSLKNFLQNNHFDSSVVTDNERHALALMALGINPYTGTNINYIKKITDSFDGTQIGDASLINDDIFGLIVLSKVGYVPNDEIITKEINYILKNQSSDGSWGGSIDMTSASIQALHTYLDISGVSNAITKAENYLIQNQNQTDGGFGNNFSTSWALQALSLDPSLSNATSKADTYLASKQQTDGGMEDLASDISTRIWSTAYTVPAILHKSFGDSVQSFAKYIPPAPAIVSSGGGGVVVIQNQNQTITPAIISTPDEKKTDDNDKLIPIEEKPVVSEKEIIKLSVPTKIVKNIKIKQSSKNVINENKLTKLVSDNIDLSASAANTSSANHSSSYKVASAIISTISAPFRWLLIHLGF